MLENRTETNCEVNDEFPSEPILEVILRHVEELNEKLMESRDFTKNKAEQLIGATPAIAADSNKREEEPYGVVYKILIQVGRAHEKVYQLNNELRKLDKII